MLVHVSIYGSVVKKKLLIDNICFICLEFMYTIYLHVLTSLKRQQSNCQQIFQTAIVIKFYFKTLKPKSSHRKTNPGL